jgi:CTP:molybdopterin cytidylyltransferase MocA
MGRPKALLPDPDGRPFVARLIRTCAAAGVERIVVVTGGQHDAIAAAVDADAPPLAPLLHRNPNPARGQISSVWAGLDAIADAAIDAVLVAPVDIPMVRQSTVRAVLEMWTTSHAPIVRPARGAQHGHPVLFDRALFDELRRAPLDEGARAVVHAYAGKIIDVQVDDPGCVIDVDTPADYQRLLGKAAD